MSSASNPYDARPPRAGPRLLGDLLGAALGPLARKADAQLDLAARLRETVGEPAASAITTCNLRPDGTLVILAASSEWAARLRFESDRLLAACREPHPEATRLRIRVAPPP